ncbi:MAG TPA: hypothetical protein VIJ01_03940 [Candidatus Angelobacter sp.]
MSNGQDFNPEEVPGITKEQKFNERQEQKRLAFEADQDQKRQLFEVKLEAQKAKRDWMMVIITFAAVSAAYWTGWEARQTRIEAASAAKESLKIQQESVQSQLKAFEAQIDALHSDLRPYLSVTPNKFSISKNKKGINAAGSISLKVEGKTPALEIRSELTCKFSNNFAGMSGPLDSDYYSLDSFLYPHQIFTHKCSANILSYTDRTVLLVYGQIKYTDYNRQPLVTPFCYYIPKPRQNSINFISCPESDGTYK